MKKIILFISLLLCLQIEAQINIGNIEKTVQAYVDTVKDGDTYWVIAKYNGIKQRFKVRLVNVDCPELEFKAKHRPEQPYSVQSKEQVANLIQHKTVSMTYFLKNQYSKPTIDQFGRPLVFISVDKQRLDDIIIYNGWGWYDNSYHTTKPYPHGKDLMELAKKDKAGLWALPDPIKPSDWRKGIISYGKVGQVLMSNVENKQWIDLPISDTKSLTAKYKSRLDSLNTLVYDLERRVINVEQRLSTHLKEKIF